MLPIHSSQQKDVHLPSVGQAEKRRPSLASRGSQVPEAQQKEAGGSRGEVQKRLPEVSRGKILRGGLP